LPGGLGDAVIKNPEEKKEEVSVSKQVKKKPTPKKSLSVPK